MKSQKRANRKAVKGPSKHNNSFKGGSESDAVYETLI